MGFVRGFAAFWYDFIIGDDWKIAVGVVAVLALGVIGVLAGASGAVWLAPALGVLFGAAFVTSMVLDVRKK